MNLDELFTDHIRRSFVEPVEGTEIDTWEPCIWDKQHYPTEEMVFDEEGCCYIHKKNIHAYLEDLVGNLSEEEHKEYKEKLLKQL